MPCGLFNLYCVIDQEQQRTRQFRVDLSRGLSSTHSLKIPNSNPGPQPMSWRKQRPVSPWPCHDLKPWPQSQKECSTRMVRESRVRPPHPPPLPNPSPGGDEVPSPPRCQQHSRPGLDIIQSLTQLTTVDVFDFPDTFGAFSGVNATRTNQRNLASSSRALTL